MSEEEKIERARKILSSILGAELPKYCDELSSAIEEYKIARGLDGSEKFDKDDFLRWLEANKYDWIN